MNIFDVLCKKTQVFRKNLLEASAGTGKTFAIEHIYIRLLLETKEDLFSRISLVEILVVTFTKKATRDLKQRIRKNLEIAINILTKNHKKNHIYDYLNPYIMDKKAINILKQALFLFNQAEIFTIHGFCFSSLNQFGYLAGENFDNENDDFNNLSIDNISFIKMKEIAVDYIKHHLENKFLYSEISILLDKHLDVDTFLKKLLNTSLNREREHLYFFEILEKINSNLKDFQNLQFNKDQFLSDFEIIKKRYKKSRENIAGELDIFIKILEDKKLSKINAEEITLSKANIIKFLSDKNMKKRVSENISTSSDSIIVFLQEKVFPLILSLIDCERIFNLLSIEINEEIDKRSEEEGIFSFDSLLTKMKKAIDKKSFIKRIKSKYKAVIIDEFQDTDPLQWEIFKNLFLLDNKNIEAFYLVGDPKQSIYSFRNADLYTYFGAANFLGKSSHYVLNTNYRSNPQLINSLNYFFSNDFTKDWLELPKIEKIIKYKYLQSGIKKDDLLDKNLCMHFLLLEDSSKKCSLNNESEEIILENIVEKIQFLTKSTKVQFKDIAILIKDRYQAYRVKKFLEKRKIPSFTKLNYSICQTEAFDNLYDLLQAVLNPKDLNKIKIALLGKFFNYLDKDLLSNNLIGEMQLFGTLNIALKRGGFSQFFTSFLKVKIKGKTINETILSRENKSFHKHFIQLVELFLTHENTINKSDKSILSFLNYLKSSENDPEINKNFLIKTDLNLNSVNIMTMHLSKGLEFDVVFALGVATSSSNRKFSSSSNLTNGSLLSDSLSNDSLSNDYLNMNERLRQLYVSFTRAKKKLYIPFLIYDKYESFNKLFASPLELYLTYTQDFAANIDLKTFFQDKIKHLQDKNIVTVERISKDIKQKDFYFNVEKYEQIDFIKGAKSFEITKEKKRYLSFSSIHNDERHFKIPNLSEKKEIILSSDILPKGANSGVMMHTIFENLFKASEKNLFSNKNYIENIARDILIKENCGDNLPLIVNSIYNILNTAIPSLGFALSEVDIASTFVETKFLFQKDPFTFVKGFIDLAFMHKGKFYILDWKTNWLGNEYIHYTKNLMEKEMKLNDYFTQAAIYSRAMKNYVKNLTSENISFDKIFGGAIYAFIRGIDNSSQNGFYVFKPDLNLIKDMCFKH